jgi:hypothetical protein
VIRRLAFLAVLLAAFLPAVAAPDDAAYYKRTATKPPAEGEFVLGPSFHYAEQLSPGVSFGYVWKASGIALIGDFAAMRIDAQTGEAPFRVGCRTFLAPYSTDPHTRGQISIGLLVPLRGYAKAAP